MPDSTPLRLLLADCRRLLSVRGEANGPLLAQEIMRRVDALDDAQRARFFDRLAALPGDAHHALWRLAAHYLVQVSPQHDGDPVARFHLDNGARLERLNAQANLAAKGLKQSAGLMVNYLYDLAKIELHHDRFAHGKVACSRAISALL